VFGSAFSLVTRLLLEYELVFGSAFSLVYVWVFVLPYHPLMLGFLLVFE
jgi:hypothetical protein